MMKDSPAALQLRYLQTMADMATNGKTSSVFFPLPIELTNAFQEFTGHFAQKRPDA